MYVYCSNLRVKLRVTCVRLSQRLRGAFAVWRTGCSLRPEIGDENDEDMTNSIGKYNSQVHLHRHSGTNVIVLAFRCVSSEFPTFTFPINNIFASLTAVTNLPAPPLPARASPPYPSRSGYPPRCECRRLQKAQQNAQATALRLSTANCIRRSHRIVVQIA
ncbi:unnamed protein product, partial [Iphiclides podalirius]